MFLQPGESKAIELLMRQGARDLFEWWTDGGVVAVASRGAPADSAPRVPSGPEGGTSLDAAEGELVAASDGLHGWSWRNQGRTVVTVTLHVQGDYQELREVK